MHKITKSISYLSFSCGHQVLHCKVEPQGQKSVVEVLCKEGDNGRQDGDVLFTSSSTSLLTADGQKSVNLEDFEEQEVGRTFAQQLTPVQAQLWILAQQLLSSPSQANDRQI